MHLSLIFFFKQPAVLDNLLGSMKYVLTGMGLLRINLENPKNRVRGIMYHVPTMSSYVKCFNDVQFIQTNRLRYSDTNISVHIEIVCWPMMALPFFLQFFHWIMIWCCHILIELPGNSKKILVITQKQRLHISLSLFLMSTVLLRYTLQYFIFHFQQHAQVILTCTCCFDKRHNMISPVYSALRALWQDRGVRNAVSRGYEYELNDSAI